MSILNKIKTLVLGSSIGQFISLVTMPIIAQCYSQESIGQAVLVISYITVITSFISLGYSNAIYVTKLRLYESIFSKLSVFFSCVLSILVFFPIFIFVLNFSLLVSVMACFIIVTGNLSLTLLNILTVSGDIKSIRDYNVIQSALLNPIKISLSFFPNHISLIFSQLLRDVLIIFRFRKKILKVLFIKKSTKQYKLAILRAGSFPLYNLPNVAANSLAALFPLIWIGRIYDLNSVAIFELATKFTMVLVLVISSSLSSIYVSEFIKIQKLEPTKLRSYMLAFSRYIAPSCLFVLIFIYFFVPVIIDVLMPKSWGGAIDVVYLYLYYIPFLMIGTIYGRVFTIIGRQGYSLVWNTLKLFILFIFSLYSQSQGVGFLEYVRVVIFCLIATEIIRVVMVYYLLAERFFCAK